MNIAHIFDSAIKTNSLRAAQEYLVRQAAGLSKDDYRSLLSMIGEHFGRNITSHEVSVVAPKTTGSNVEAACLDSYGFYSPELLLNTTKDGNVKIIPNLTNYKIIIQHLFPTIKYSEFERKPYINNEPMTTDDTLKIASAVTVFLKGHNVKTKEIDNAIRLVAIDNKFNPLADYFTSLPISHTNHLENWLTNVCGVVDSPINRVLGRKWLISCVARAIKPGSYVEGSLIFYGKQGAGKTSFFKNINPKEEYYCGSNVDISNTQKASQTYQGKFIIEFGELAAIGKAELEDAKQYLTETHDTYVPKYENLAVSMPRMMVFGGSTNHLDILHDTTGNRRFWCVEVADNMDIDLLKSIKEELWSEAYQAFMTGESWVLTSEEREMLEESNGHFQADDPLKDYVLQHLNSTEDAILSSAEINKIAKQFDIRAHSKTVAKIMDSLNWKKIKATSGPNKDCTIYIRPSNSKKQEAEIASAWN